MAVVSMTGFDGGDAGVDNTSIFSGTASYNTGTVRGGARSVRCNPASGASGLVTVTNITGWLHFAVNFATLPSVDRFMLGATNTVALKITSAGTLAYYDNSVLIGTGSKVLSTATWYWIGVRLATGTSVVLLQIDGVNELSGTHTAASTFNGVLGFGGTEASAVDAYFDDHIVDDTAFLAPSKVALLLPISDNANGTGWTNDAAGTTNLFNAVKNTPPQGIADTTASTGLHQIRNATSNANVNYDANLTTYSTAGILAADTVLAVQQMVETAAPVTTSSKQGTFGMSSNPVIANVALSSGGTAGAFWQGNAASTYNSGWKASYGAVTTSPSVTLGSSPVARITQVTSNTRIAMVCFMGMMVAWTPAAVVANPPHTSPYPPLLAQ